MNLVTVHTAEPHDGLKLSESLMTYSSSSSQAARSPITVAAGFAGAFIVASLAVQMVRSQTSAFRPSANAGQATNVEPVIASQAAMWSVLGTNDAN